MGRGGGRLIALGLLVAATATGCADHDELSFCDVYDSYLDVVEPTLATDPTTVTAAEAATAAEDAYNAARRLREVGDSRYTAATDGLTEVLDDLRRTLASFDPDEAYDTWQPLVNDTIDDALIAHERLVELVAESCDVPT